MFHFKRATARTTLKNAPGLLRDTPASAVPRQVKWKLGSPLLLLAALASTNAIVVAEAADTADKAVQITIPAGTLADALDKLGDQSGVQIMYEPAMAEGIQVAPVNGTLTVRDALGQLLAATGLKADRVNEKTVVLKRASDTDVAKKNSDTPSPRTVTAVEEITVTGKIPEVLVVGSKILNMDIQRTEDDPQPYVIFDRSQIERSGATNIQDFLKQRLTMNASAQSNNQLTGVTGNSSSIDLRGLGTNQTLVLVDGHRAVSISDTGTPNQPDLNGIPLAAIERIEVLPATASGIYGGSATGGVVNIVLRRDYSGAELKLTYDNTFDADASRRRVDFGSGFNLEEGRTNILIAGSYQEAAGLRVGDRDFVRNGRANILGNNPATFLTSTPPIGATPNIRSSNGSNLTLRSTGQPLDSPLTYIPYGYSGTASDMGAALVPNAGQYNFDLPRSAQAGAGTRANFVGGTVVKSLSATVRREFTPSVQAFIDLFASDNDSRSPGTVATSTFSLPVSAPNNPFNQPITVRVGNGSTDGVFVVSHEDRRAVGGLIVRLPQDWSVEADYTWDRSRRSFHQPDTFSSALAPAVANGTVDILRDPAAVPLDFSPYLIPANASSPTYATLKDSIIRVAGPVGSLPAGDPTLSAMIEYRDELIDDSYGLSSTGTVTYRPSRSQTTRSAYLEAKVPLVAPRNNVPAVRELDLQLSVRRDEYTVNGVTSSVVVGSPAPIVRATNEQASNDPTMGLRYSPVQDVTLRASYGTGFLAPSVNQVISTPGTVNDLRDPLRGNEERDGVAVLTGGSTEVKPESSKSWSVGFILTPRFVTGLRWSVDYTKIEKTDNILSTLTFQDIINNESLFPGRVTRGPAAGVSCTPLCPITAVDGTAVNIARAKIEAFDTQLDFNLPTAGAGEFAFYAVATYLPHYETQQLPTSPVIENVGVNTAFSSIPLKLKVNAGMTWAFRSWTLGWDARYLDSYIVSTSPSTIANQGDGGRVSSQHYHDFFAKYRVNRPYGLRLLDGLEVRLGIENAFDEEPPFDANYTQYYYSPFGDPRLRSYSVSVRQSF